MLSYTIAKEIDRIQGKEFMVEAYISDLEANLPKDSMLSAYLRAYDELTTNGEISLKDAERLKSLINQLESQSQA